MWVKGGALLNKTNYIAFSSLDTFTLTCHLTLCDLGQEKRLVSKYSGQIVLVSVGGWVKDWWNVMHFQTQLIIFCLFLFGHFFSDLQSHPL